MDIFQARTQRNDIAVLQDGLLAPARMGDAYGLATMDAHGRYYDAVRRGNVFFATNSTAQALSVNSTTATGIVLVNPPGSGKNVAILEVMFTTTTAPGGSFSAILTGGIQTATLTPTVGNVANGVLNALIGGGNSSKTLVGASATIATATVQRIVGAGVMATAGITPAPIKDEVAGALVIPPGFLTSLQCVGTAPTGWGQITWEELPV